MAISGLIGSCLPPGALGGLDGSWRWFDPLASGPLRRQPPVHGIALRDGRWPSDLALLDQLAKEMASANAFLDSHDCVLRTFVGEQLIASPVHLSLIGDKLNAVDAHHSGRPALHQALPLQPEVVCLFIGASAIGADLLPPVLQPGGAARDGKQGYAA